MEVISGMSNYLVITAVGEDQPGIVKRLSHTITEHSCNIEDSRMSILGGEFAMILLLSGNWNDIAKLENALPKAGTAMSLKITCKHTEARQPRPDQRTYQVEVLAVDQPGIVHQVSEFFARREINIDSLNSESYNAAHTGTPMFALTLALNIPKKQAIADLRDDFLDFCDSLNLDGVIEAVRT